MKKFQCIVADPPWFFFDALKMSDVARGAGTNYDTMTISDIKSLPVKSIADPDGALLALWVPSSLLQDGLDVMKAWGFTHKQTYIWVKNKNNSFISLIKWIKKCVLKQPQVLYDKFSYKRAINVIIESLNNFNLDNILSFGMGRLFRQTHEVCLIGINNKKIYKQLANKSQRSVSFGINLKHSSKPDHLQNSLEIMFPHVNKLEMFARRHKKNWICIGNEVCNGEDIAVSLEKLI